MKFTCSIAPILLLFLGFHCVLGSKEDVKFKLNINEKGTRFSENIKINEKENTVRFTVPKHNDVDRSDVLNDFNLNLTISRLPDKRVCYIEPLDKHLPSPRKLKSDMTYVRSEKARIEKTGALVSSNELAINGQVEAKDLHPAVAKFCAGFPVYRLKEINRDNIEIEQEERSSNDSIGSRKRGLEKRNGYDLPWCEREPLAKSLPCSIIKRKIFCKLIARKCVFWARCNLTIFEKVVSFSIVGHPCKFEHEYNSLLCCEFRCSTK